jgi:hypothetical protein
LALAEDQLMADWFYAQNGQQQGPVTIEALHQMAASGQLRSGDMVWSSEMAGWQPAGQTAGVFPAGATPPPVPIAYASPAPYMGPQQSLGQNAGARWLLPVGRSGWAIAAGYLGLLSFILFPAPLALICSIVAILDMRKHPDRHGMGRAIFGLIMGVLGTIGLCFMLVAIFSSHAPPPVRPRVSGY